MGFVNPVPVIDQLPQDERQKVLDRFMAGESNASIARSIGLSRGTVSSYRRRYVLPTLQALGQVGSHQHGISVPDTLLPVAQQSLRSSPFQERLRATWERIERVLERAENAVQVTADGDPVGEDLAVLAPLLNQAHKNLELLGKASGELLDKSAAPTISIQVVVPAGATVAQQAAEGDVIDVGSIPIGLRR